MSSKSTPEISLRSIELKEDVRTSILNSLSRQTMGDSKIIFFAFTFLGFGLAGLARLLWFSNFTTIHSAITAISCGLLGAIGMTLLHILEVHTLRKELKTGICIEASVFCDRAIRVRIAGSSLEGIAMDCGDEVLVLIGDWWLNKNRSDIWVVPKSQKKFPAQRFRIQFLPQSGKVLAVLVEKGPLIVDEREPVQPLIALKFSKYSEIVHMRQGLRSLIVDEGQRR